MRQKKDGLDIVWVRCDTSGLVSLLPSNSSFHSILVPYSSLRLDWLCAYLMGPPVPSPVSSCLALLVPLIYGSSARFVSSTR